MEREARGGIVLKNQAKLRSGSIGASAVKPAALGFRAHSGWAALVAVTGPMRAPAVIERRRIELADPKIPRPVQPYHAAQKMDLKAAEKHVRRFTDEARLLAQRTLAEVTNTLRGAGYETVGCGIPLGSGRAATTLEATLASHPLLHTAEGELFRGAIMSASEHFHLPMTGVRERDLLARGATELGMTLPELQRRLTELGRAVGPPWGQDQKLATLVAWLALAADERKGSESIPKVGAGAD
jgi:hypothetical protein